MKTRFRQWLLCLFLIAPVILAGAEEPNLGGPRDRILILVSLDGFRWDYLQKFKAQTPHLNQLAVEGVHMQRLIPVFPSLTFPNHYTIATGFGAEQHRLLK